MDNSNSVGAEKDVQELIEFARKNKMSSAADKLESAISYLDAMQDKIDDMMQQMDEMRREINGYENSRYISFEEKAVNAIDNTTQKIIDAVSNAISKTEVRLIALNELLRRTKEEFKGKVKTALFAFKNGAKNAANLLVEVTHIKPGLEKLKKGVDGGIQETNDIIDRLEVLGKELEAAKHQKRNAFRIFRSKAPKEFDENKQGMLTVLSVKPWRWQRGVYESVSLFLDAAIQKMNDLAKDVESKSVADINPNDHTYGVDMNIATSVAEDTPGYEYSDDGFEEYMGNNPEFSKTDTPDIPKETNKKQI